MKKAAAFWIRGCDLGNENGCLSYNQIVLMQTLQDACVKKGDLISCRQIGGEVFLAWKYDQEKLILDDICKMRDKASCSELLRSSLYERTF